MKQLIAFLMAALFSVSMAMAQEKKDAPKPADKPAAVKECKDKDGKVIKCPDEPKKDDKKPAEPAKK